MKETQSLNHLSIRQWVRSAIHVSQQPNTPIGFLSLKLPPPPCAGTTGIGQTSLDSNLNLKHGKMCLFVSHPFLGLHVSRCMQHVFRFYAIFTSLCAFCRVVVPTQPFTNTALYYKMLLESEPTPPAAKCFWGF